MSSEDFNALASGDDASTRGDDASTRGDDASATTSSASVPIGAGTQAEQPSSGDHIPPEAWRKFHKVTPISQLGAFWFVICFGIFSVMKQMFEDGNLESAINGVRDNATTEALLILLGALLLISVVVVGVGTLIWKKMSYGIVPSGIHYRKGIFIKQHKHIPWNRIQSVEVEQRLFGRIFGFGSVKVDSAGMQSENMDLGLLRLSECSSLRKEILQALNSARTGTPVAVQTTPLTASGSPTVPAPQGTIAAQGSVNAAGVVPENEFNAVPILDADDDERDVLVYKLGTGQMLVANIFDTQTLLMVFFTLMPLVLTIIAGDVQFFALIFPILAVGWTILKSLLDDYGTKIYLSENGLRRRAGLTKVITRTIPPQRVHAIGLSQPLLWRRFDWWKLDLTTADKDLKELKQLSQSFILAGTREEVLRILWTLTPSLGSDDDRALLAEALDGQGTGKYFMGAPKSARLLDPISLPGRGVFASVRTLIVRQGRWSRKISLILQDHTQSTMATVGPIQRYKNLASVKIHTVLGRVDTKVKNFDRNFVEQLLMQETELARQARSIGVSESLAEWKARVGLGN
ncbi:PH domain-containing protein [Arcanobacterium bovis]|uniref:YdbS-like PH domain-containing protein n=1 Tax=Arcanobacterium bovis TaxID=2529275 RepID=A0A4Q9V1E3_9ACTO|nr:PH domain-containing protein [Arcanobacterium bovis]TBW21491.1 hypothetical protein EZJ44_05995 [Arcanobacterium bovis]